MGLAFFQLATLLLAPLASAKVPSIEGFKLTWSEDFIGPENSLPSTANWLISTGTSYPGGAANWGTGEIQTYTSKPENVRLTGNGTLRITAIKDAAGAWTSSRIETARTNFQAAKGKKMRIQGRIAMPDVTGQQAIGYWPAFWTLGAPFRGNYQNWPSIGEFDILENVNGLNNVFGTLHCGSNPGGPCNETTGISSKNGCIGSSCQGNFHVFTIEIDRAANPEQMKWFVDGQQYHSVTATKIGQEVWDAIVGHGHFILLNLAMGGSFPNNAFGSTTPLESTVSGKYMEVDYVAVYNN